MAFQSLPARKQVERLGAAAVGPPAETALVAASRVDMPFVAVADTEDSLASQAPFRVAFAGASLAWDPTHKDSLVDTGRSQEGIPASAWEQVVAEMLQE